MNSVEKQIPVKQSSVQTVINRITRLRRLSEAAKKGHRNKKRMREANRGRRKWTS